MESRFLPWREASRRRNGGGRKPVQKAVSGRGRRGALKDAILAELKVAGTNGVQGRIWLPSLESKSEPACLVCWNG